MFELYLAVLLVVLAIIFFVLASRQRQKAGIPAGRVIYTDASQWGKVEKPLYDPVLRITGKPDYLVKQVTRLSRWRLNLAVHPGRRRILISTSWQLTACWYSMNLERVPPMGSSITLTKPLPSISLPNWKPLSWRSSMKFSHVVPARASTVRTKMEGAARVAGIDPSAINLSGYN